MKRTPFKFDWETAIQRRHWSSHSWEKCCNCSINIVFCWFVITCCMVSEVFKSQNWIIYFWELEKVVRIPIKRERKECVIPYKLFFLTPKDVYRYCISDLNFNFNFFFFFFFCFLVFSYATLTENQLSNVNSSSIILTFKFR